MNNNTTAMQELCLQTISRTLEKPAPDSDSCVVWLGRFISRKLPECVATVLLRCLKIFDANVKTEAECQQAKKISVRRKLEEAIRSEFAVATPLLDEYLPHDLANMVNQYLPKKSQTIEAVLRSLAKTCNKSDLATACTVYHHVFENELYPDALQCTLTDYLPVFANTLESLTLDRFTSFPKRLPCRIQHLFSHFPKLAELTVTAHYFSDLATCAQASLIPTSLRKLTIDCRAYSYQENPIFSVYRERPKKFRSITGISNKSNCKNERVTTADLNTIAGLAHLRILHFRHHQKVIGQEGDRLIPDATIDLLKGAHHHLTVTTETL